MGDEADAGERNGRQPACGFAAMYPWLIYFLPDAHLEHGGSLPSLPVLINAFATLSLPFSPILQKTWTALIIESRT